MAKKDTNQHLAILQDIRNKVFKPVYLLMGEESYYIDLICETIIENALKDSERDFNQTILYGADIDDFAIDCGRKIDHSQTVPHHSNSTISNCIC